MIFVENSISVAYNQAHSKPIETDQSIRSIVTASRTRMKFISGRLGSGSTRLKSPPVYLALLGIILILATFLDQRGDAAALNQVGTKLRTNKDRGCYYMLQHYKNGEQIKTDEPCLNCTCDNSMLMCYLRVCPYVKPIGDRCIVERVPGECCPKITCSDVSPPAEGFVQEVEPETTVAPPAGSAETVGSNGTTANNFDIALTDASEVATGAGGCKLNGNFYHEGALLPSDPKKPCEICYCINNSSACVLQECALEVNGCAPIYQAGGCCPTRYNCTSSATGQRRVSPAANRRKFWENLNGFASSSTTDTPSSPDVLSFSTSTTTKPMTLPNFGRDAEKPSVSGCRASNSSKIYADGERVLSKNKCEHCYCMRNEIVCAVQECRPPCEGCTPIYEGEKDCCPKRYECAAPTQRVSTDNIVDSQAETTTATPSAEQQPPSGVVSASVNLEITPEPSSAPRSDSQENQVKPEETPVAVAGSKASTDQDSPTAAPSLIATDSTGPEMSVMTTRQTNPPLRPISPKLSGEDDNSGEPMPADQDSTKASKPAESRDSSASVDGFSLNGEREQETDLTKAAGRFVAPEGSVIPSSGQASQDANEIIPPSLTSTIPPPSAAREESDTATASDGSKPVELQNSDKRMRPQVIPSMIPGEGGCRYNGRLYSNGQEVKSKDNCMEICMCINGVVYCDEIDCPKGPENQDNCKRIVVEGECCPKYICDEAAETRSPVSDVTRSSTSMQPNELTTPQATSVDQMNSQPSEAAVAPEATTTTASPSFTTTETPVMKEENALPESSTSSVTAPTTTSAPLESSSAATDSGPSESIIPEAGTTSGEQESRSSSQAPAADSTTTAADISTQTPSASGTGPDAADAESSQPTSTTLQDSTTTQSPVSVSSVSMSTSDATAPAESQDSRLSGSSPDASSDDVASPAGPALSETAPVSNQNTEAPSTVSGQSAEPSSISPSVPSSSESEVKSSPDAKLAEDQTFVTASSEIPASQTTGAADNQASSSAASIDFTASSVSSDPVSSTSALSEASTLAPTEQTDARVQTEAPTTMSTPASSGPEPQSTTASTEISGTKPEDSSSPASSAPVSTEASTPPAAEATSVDPTLKSADTSSSPSADVSSTSTAFAETTSPAVVAETTAPIVSTPETSTAQPGLPSSSLSPQIAEQPSGDVSSRSEIAEPTASVSPVSPVGDEVSQSTTSSPEVVRTITATATSEQLSKNLSDTSDLARAEPSFGPSTTTVLPPEMRVTSSPGDEFLASISSINGSSFKPVEITTVIPSIRGQSTPITIPWSHIANNSQPEATTDASASLAEQPTAITNFSNTTLATKTLIHEPTQSSVGVSESDYEEIGEEPGCEYEGKTYNSAQQIPRLHPCDFCFCFRGDIICLQQTCPPPVPHCFESVMDGFCCPRYECPVHTVRSSPNSTSLSLTPFESHSQLQQSSTPQELSSSGRSASLRGSSVKGCFVDNKLYAVGQDIASASGPCLDCKCDKNGMMKCNPKECTPEDPLLQQINREVLQSTLSRGRVR